MKFYRLQNKYSCQEIANILKLKPNTITQYESGKRHVPEKVIHLYCDLFGITPNTLYGFEEKKEKYNIPLYQAILKNKTAIGLNNKYIKKIPITSVEKNKGYSFAIQAWNMDNNPKIYTGDIIFLGKIENTILSGDCILYLENEIPYIKLYREKNNNILLDTFSYKISREFHTKESFSNLKVIGRVLEVRSILKKGGNPWPNGK